MFICVDCENRNALYYLKSIGRRRIYRQTYPIPQFKNLKLFTYKNKGNAEKICDYVNEQTGSNYKAKEV